MYQETAAIIKSFHVPPDSLMPFGIVIHLTVTAEHISFIKPSCSGKHGALRAIRAGARASRVLQSQG